MIDHMKFLSSLSEKGEMMRITIAALALAIAAIPVQAQDWPVADMNDHIEQTNFIVGNHCSGTLISLEHRLILTNEHCTKKYIRHRQEDFVDAEGVVKQRKVEQREEVQVSQRFYDRHKLVTQNSYIGDIVDFDEKFDLAIIQLRQTKLLQTRAARIFTGDQVYRGETVYAIGNPMMLDASVTRGIISNVNRLIQVGRDRLPYFQMDAGIVGGSSGGALYNSDGLLIGVPAAAAAGTSVGLAIPYYTVQEFLAANCFHDVYGAEPVAKCAKDDPAKDSPEKGE